MQRWTIVIALVAIIFLAATPANAFHHRYRGCGYGGCGYGGCGYGGCGYGGCSYGGYGYGGPYAWGGYRPYYGYGAYGLYGNVGTPIYGSVVYGSNYAVPGYPSVNYGYAAPRPLAAPSMPSRNGNAATQFPDFVNQRFSLNFGFDHGHCPTTVACRRWPETRSCIEGSRMKIRARCSCISYRVECLPR